MHARMFSVVALILLLGADGPKKAEIPEINKKVLAFCEANLGKKVGDGECAALAMRALQKAGADRSSYSIQDRDYVWGKRVRTVMAGANLTGEVLPGDILQFRDAVFKSKIGRETVESFYPHHTAIVAAVKKEGRDLEILQQNVSDPSKSEDERRTVQRATLRFNDMQKGGWVKIYRPVPRAEGE